MIKKMHFDEESAKLLRESLPKDYPEKVFALLEEKEAFQAILSPEASEAFELVDNHNEGLKILENNAHFFAGFKFGLNLLLKFFVADVSD